MILEFLDILEIVLFFLSFLPKYRILAIPLFFIGLITNSFEIGKMKKNNKIRLWQLGRCVGLVFVEFFLFLNYFIHIW